MPVGPCLEQLGSLFQKHSTNLVQTVALKLFGSRYIFFNIILLRPLNLHYMTQTQKDRKVFLKILDLSNFLNLLN